MTAPLRFPPAQLAKLLTKGTRPTTAFRSTGWKREDLGIFTRSMWEANYARYLNLLKTRGVIREWEYEPHTFTFDGIRRGTTNYTPDFKVTFPSGGHEWHEVKGWMDKKSATRLKRMAKYHPAEKVVVIDQAWFREANRSGLAGIVPGWERVGR